MKISESSRKEKVESQIIHLPASKGLFSVTTARIQLA